MPNEIYTEEIKYRNEYFSLSGVEFLCILFYIFQTLHPVMSNQFSFFFSYFLRLIFHTEDIFPRRKFTSWKTIALLKQTIIPEITA